MMKTALSIIQGFRYRAGLSAPTTLESVTDPDELQLLYLLYAVCEELRAARCWAQQKKTCSFDTEEDRRLYPFPADYYSALPGTHYNQDESNLLIGPVSDAEMNFKLYGEASSSTNYTFRIFGADQRSGTAGGQIEVDPTPSSAQTLSFDYLTRNLFMPAYWTAETAYTTNATVTANGNIYVCLENGTSDVTAPSGTSSSIDDGTTTWAYTDAPKETVTDDTDLCLFDYDIVTLGLRAKWYEENAGAFELPKAEFEAKIANAKARMASPSVGSFCGGSIGPRYRTPYKSWSLT